MAKTPTSAPDEQITDAPEQMGFPSELDWFDKPDADEQKPQQAQPDPTVAALQTQLAALTEQLADRRALSMLPYQQYEAPTPQFNTQVNMDGLPDPVEDPQGYARELGTRFSTAYQQARMQEQWQAHQQNQQTSRYDALWDEFREAHPDYAEHEELVEAAAKKVANRYRARGIDMQRYMFANPEQFFGELTGEIDKFRGTPAGAGDQGTDTPDDAPVSRTAGMFGGAETGGKPTKGPKQQQARPESMFDDIASWQQKTGFYR